MMPKETPMTKQYRLNQTTCFAAEHTEQEKKATLDTIRGTGQFSSPSSQTGVTGAACGMRLTAQVRAAAPGTGFAHALSACCPLFPNCACMAPLILFTSQDKLRSLRRD